MVFETLGEYGLYLVFLLINVSIGTLIGCSIGFKEEELFKKYCFWMALLWIGFIIGALWFQYCH